MIKSLKLKDLDKILAVVRELLKGNVDYTSDFTTLIDSIKALEGGYSVMLGKVSGGTFVATIAGSGTDVTCTSLPSQHPTLINEDIEKIEQVRAGAVVETYHRETSTITVAGNVITVAGASFDVSTDTVIVYTNVALVASPNYTEDSDHTTGDVGTQMLAVRDDSDTPMAADGKYIAFSMDSSGHLRVNTGSTSAAGDVAHDAADSGNPVKVGARARNSAITDVDNDDRTDLIATLKGMLAIAGLDWTEDSLKMIEQSPRQNHRVTVEHDAILTATAKSYYVIPMDTYKSGSFFNKFTMGAGSVATVKIYMTNDASADISASGIATDIAADDTWNDVSLEIIKAASLSCGAAATTSDTWFMDTNMVAEYYVIEVDYTDAADSTVEIKAKLVY